MVPAFQVQHGFAYLSLGYRCCIEEVATGTRELWLERRGGGGTEGGNGSFIQRGEGGGEVSRGREE